MKTNSLLYRINRRDHRLLPKFPAYTKFILIAISIVGVSILAKNIFAQTFTDEFLQQNFIKQKQEALTKGDNQESWLNEAFGSNVITGISAISGEIPDDVLLGKTTSWVPSGMMGGVNQMIAYTYTTPASGVSYIADLKNNFLGKPVYAQNGIGFNGLNPILPIWKIFRNITYILASLLFLIIGILIMLRIKISPQAVITIQTAIPKIISTLILITFSYAIAGLVIDLVNFVQAASIAMLFKSTNVQYTQDLFWNNQGTSEKIVDVINRLLTDPGAFFINLVHPNNLQNLSQMDLFRFNMLMREMVPKTLVVVIGGILGAVIGAIFSAGVGALPGAGIGIALFILIFEIFMLIQIFKILFGLTKTYFTVLLLIILAPFEIAMGAIPNSKQGFSSWFTKLIGNILVFPAVCLFVILVILIIKMMDGYMIWSPSPLSINATGGALLIKFIVGFGGLMILPKLPSLIPEAVFQIKPSPFGKALGEATSHNIVAGTAGYLGGAASTGATGVISRNVSYGIRKSKAYKNIFNPSPLSGGGRNNGGNNSGGNNGGGGAPMNP